MKNTPPGADMRFVYVSFSGLWPQDQATVPNKYPHGVAYIPDSEYIYPVKKNGRPAPARRYISTERAQELHDLCKVREVMES